MWEAIFDPNLSVLEKLIRAVVLYAFLVLALRVSGKRLMAQLTTFDFVVILLVSNTVQDGLIGSDDTVTGAVVSATALLVLNGGLGYLFFRSRGAKRAIAGEPVVLVREGVIDEVEMRRQRFSHTDLLVALQDAGTADPADVRLARLEADGQMLVTPMPESGPTRADLMDAIDALTAQVDRLAAQGR